MLASFGCRKTYSDEIFRCWCDCWLGLGEQHLLDVDGMSRAGCARYGTHTQKSWDIVNGETSGVTGRESANMRCVCDLDTRVC